MEKLKQDLHILEMMASEMEEYLRSHVLFWPMARGDYPRLTVGAYLLRQHRLLALSDLLSEADRAQLAAAMTEFQAALGGGIVRFENRAYEELAMRLRQWERFLSDSPESSAAYFATTVETRAIIAALLSELEMGPYELRQRHVDQVALLDKQLRARWQPGDFVWPEDWQPAYPKTTYWWLYGMPG